jgi:hypothetical protein
MATGLAVFEAMLEEDREALHNMALVTPARSATLSRWSPLPRAHPTGGRFGAS